MVIVAFKPNKKEYSYEDELFQYDYGQILRIQGLQLPAAVEVHFSAHSTDGTTITRLGTTKDGVTDVPIPDSLLENEYNMGDYKIYAFIYLTDATSGQTEYKITLPVKARPRPEVPAQAGDPDIFKEVVETVKEFAESASQSQKLVRADKENIDKTVQEFTISSQQALANVNNAGQTQTQRVQTEGEKQVEEIENKGAEILQDCKEAGAPPIIQTVTGNPIIVQDSAERRVQGLRVFGKTTQVQTTGAQLFKYELTGESGGIKVSHGEDGVITLNGTCTKNVFITGSIIPTQGSISVAMNNASSNRNVSIKFSDKDSADISTIYPLDSANKKATITLSREAAFMIIRIERGTTLSDFTIKPMLYQQGDGTWEPFSEGKPSPSPDYPQELKSAGGDGEIEGVMHGAQLFDASRIPTKKDGGVTVTNNGDGSFTVSGANKITATYENQIILTNEETKRILHEGIVRLKEKTNIYPMFMCGLCPADANSFISNKRLDINNNSFEITKNDLQSNRLRYVFYGNVNDTIIPGTIKPMFYQDGDGTWEPYKPQQTLTLPNTNGLPGIPVSSGGNYTDVTGQQWVCDEIDLKRGVYVKRIGIIDKRYFGTIELNDGNANKKYNQYVIEDTGLGFVGTIDNGTNMKAYCTHFKLGGQITVNTNKESFWIFNKRTIVLILEKEKFPTVASVKEWIKTSEMEIMAPITPVETPLSEEVLQAFKALQTYYPTTIATNDADTDMELEYIADTKTYLDNIKKEFMEAIANTNEQLLQEVTHVRKY